MISKAFTIIAKKKKQSVYEVTSASVIQKVRQRLANIDPNVTAGQWLETV